MTCARLVAQHIPLWTANYAAYAAVMIHLERKMRSTGGPGIIPFELAGSRTAAETILEQWGVDGRQAARSSLRLDFGYMLVYGYLTALLLDRTARRQHHPRVVSMVVAAAVASDAIEGVSLLRVLNNQDLDRNTARANHAARTKFALLGVCAGYLVKFGFRSASPGSSSGSV